MCSECVAPCLRIYAVGACVAQSVQRERVIVMALRNLGQSYEERARDLSKPMLLQAHDRFAASPGNGKELAILKREIKRRKAADALLPEAFREWSE